jgi:TetR/AcrR family transcriptional regulator, transcriptional repressor for nem operon
MSISSAASDRRRGRPPQFNHDRALGELLTLFWRKGYDAATQEEMLAATGLSSSTLYRSFGNKADILGAVLQHYVSVASVMFTPLEHGHRGTADIHAFLDLIDEWIRGPMGSAGCLVVETMQNPINRDPRVSALTAAHLDRMSRALQAAVQRATSADDLPPSTADSFADALQAGVIGVLARARTGHVDDAVRLLTGVRGLLPAAS